jgi:hypothetical protein
MSYPLVAAAGLTVFIGVVHSVLGERYILTRLFRRTDLPHLLGSDWFTRRVLRFAWHLTTVAWIGLAGILLILGNEVSDPTAALTSDDGALVRSVGRVISVLFGVSALITAGSSRFKHLAWPVFAAIAALTWVGV